MKIIISGAISGTENYLEKFADVEKNLKRRFRDIDIEIFNPAEYCDDLIQSGIIDAEHVTEKELWLMCMIEVLKQFSDATHIHYLSDSTKSVGSMIESLFARRMGLEEIK